ncbi:MAG: polyphosphate kinase 1, partial [Leeuwenhoekiella sp.]
MQKDPAERLKHRDLNWLSFNERVLQEASDKRFNPLFERMKFLAIYSSNLDEYFRVRVSQLRQIKRVEKSIRKKLALRPNKIVKEILKKVKEQQEVFGKIYREEIIPELKENNIIILSSEDYSKVQKELAQIWYKTHIKADILPKIINLKEDSELFLENQSLYFCVAFRDESK